MRANRKLFVAVMLVATSTSVAQERRPDVKRTVSGEQAERDWKREQTLGELYERISGSRFVILGTVVSETIVGMKSKQPHSMDESVGGTLYKVKIEDTVCRQTDFTIPDSSKTALANDQVNLFVPFKPFSRGKEVLSTGHRYILFLVVPDKKEQKKWTHGFELSSDVTYYRTKEGSRGAIERPKSEPESSVADDNQLALDTITQLCNAMKPVRIDDKITALRELTKSGDDILKNEANKALKALRVKNQKK